MASPSQTPSVFGTPNGTANSSPQFVTPPENEATSSNGGCPQHVVDVFNATRHGTGGGAFSSLDLASVAAHSTAAPAPVPMASTSLVESAPVASSPSTPSSTQQEPPPTTTTPNPNPTGPWDPAARIAFKSRFTHDNPTYKNKMRLPPSTFSSIRTILLSPEASATALIPTNLSNSNPNHPSRLKERAKSWMVRPMAPNGYLYRVDGTTFRRHVSEAEAWDILTRVHVETGHRGRDRMFEALKLKYVGYTLEEVMFVLQNCRICEERKKANGAVKLPSNYRTPSVAGSAGTGTEAMEHRGPPSPGLAGMSIEPVKLPVAPPAPGQMRYFAQDPDWRLKATAAAYIQPPVRPNIHMPAHNGLVHYDVPDWYSRGTR